MTFINSKVKKTLLSTLLISSLAFLVSFDNPGDKYFQIAKNLEILSSVYSEVNKEYVDDINPSDFMQKGIDAMLSSLDPYTNYIPEDAIEDYRFMSTGQYGGIGAVIAQRKGKHLILMPYEGYPAHKAGLRIADELVEIDGKKVIGKSTNDVSKLLKGEADTKLSLKIRRYGVEELLDISLMREKIKVDNVPYFGMVSEDVGYIRLKDFTTNASGEIKNALLDLKSKGAVKFILDLRGNPGGLLKEAIEISNIFVPKGKLIVSTKGKLERWSSSHNAEETPLDTESPLVVLTNNRSASASEIVSGVIQDYDRGVLLGQRTYGKGLVQTTLPVAYNAKVKVTTAKYYIPSGRCIQAIDYSNRNPDGSVGTIPDSLISEFKTTNGRVVYDGGGIAPDIETKRSQMSVISRELEIQNMIFDYATSFYHKNKDRVSSPSTFSFTDADYKDFVNWIESKDFVYKSSFEKGLVELTKLIKTDSLHHMNLDNEISAMEEKFKELKKQDFQIYKKEIVNSLEEEIVSRGFYFKGMTEVSLMHDQEVIKAISVLNDPKSYDKLLSK